MAMESGPFEDIVPIENVDIPASYVSYPGGDEPASWEGGEPKTFLNHWFCFRI